jgi:peptidoglycan/LPS O-acetylase OafA/YrhL
MRVLGWPILSELRYRPDIDGLRAIAVLGVVLFHAGVQPLTGGFSGVDVFFVISGFLISSIIIKEIRRGDFSLATFYERRIRRIFPAFLVVVLFSTILAYLLLLPRDFESFGKSLAAAGLSLSNVLFWKESGYFDSSAELKPLLHTWSLGVEEQFYLFFPLLLLFVARFFKQRWVGWILAIAVVSFLLSVWGVRYQPSAAFYLLPTRAWELALGCLLAMGAVPPIQQRHWRELEGLLGLGLIAWGMFALSLVIRLRKPEAVSPPQPY